MKNISLIFALFSLIFLTACQQDQSDTPVVSSEPTINSENRAPEPSSASSDLHLESITDATFTYKNVKNESYKYLDSLNLTYKNNAFGDLLSKHEKTIVYFYPKDGTPNCTIQALDFSLMQKDLNEKGIGVLGISQDELGSHKEFAKRNELKIFLLKDNSGSLLDAFGSRGELTTYGNGDELSDVNRSTYVVDKNGNLLYAFRDVEAKGHARAVYKILTNLDY